MSNQAAEWFADAEQRERVEKSKRMTNGELIRYSDYDDLAAFLHRMQAGAIIEGRADSEEFLREWLDEESEDDDAAEKP